MNRSPDNLPILALGRPRVTTREMLFGGPGDVRTPTTDRQTQRISPKLELLQRAFANRRVSLQEAVTGAEPEQVLVLETVGTVEEFIRAVSRIEGMEFLGEFDEQDIPPDDDFFREGDPAKSLSGTIYLVMTNQQAMQQLLSLWSRHLEEPDTPFEHGLGRFKTVFRLLRDVRAWGPTDRVSTTGVLEDWRDRVEAGLETVPLEIELWYRDSTDRQADAENEVRGLIAAAGGQSLTSAKIPEIRYHALLATLPIGTVETVLDNLDEVELVRSDRVMFFRRIGQGIIDHDDASALPTPDIARVQVAAGDPVVALLDGLPLEQHELLAGRLRVDDPDGIAARAGARSRRHGTAMASLIIHGDLSADQVSLSRPIYVRPILAPGPAWVGGAPETIPDDELPVDLTHRAIKRMFDGEGAVGPTAPSVRIVNVSIGDQSAFGQTMSPWARLLDWMSWHYKILVIVSAGNHSEGLEFDVDLESLEAWNNQEMERETLGVLGKSFDERRVRPPAEGVNMLTVGAANSDESAMTTPIGSRELITSPQVMAPYSALGMGYRRSIKPDLIAPGGRATYTLSEEADGVIAMRVVAPTSPPGQLVAAPTGPAGTRAGSTYSAGTSNAAAITSHEAANLFDVLANMRDDGAAGFLQDAGVMASALKALLVHGATLGEAFDVVSEAFAGRVEPAKMREFVSRFVGYGSLLGSAIQSSTEARATMLGGGHLSAEEAHIYEIPLPPSLSGVTGERRLTTTLSWLTPVNPRDRRYRRAKLWLSSPDSELAIDRTQADWQAARRGTLQHEVFEGDRAAAFEDGDFVTIRVNCASHAGALDDEIPYAIAVSIEVAPALGIDVFAEVRDRVRPQVGIRPRT